MPVGVMVDWERLPQIRRDPLLPGRSVIISASRGLRIKKDVVAGAYPNELPDFLETCPFCPGQEERTPATLVRLPKEGDWQVRGFANKYPFLMIEAGEKENNFSPFFKKYLAGGIGAHEVIVESPRHNARLSLASEREIALIFAAMSQRYFDLQRDNRFRYFYAFQNYGPGASQDHPHWQIEARQFAPRTIYEKCQVIGAGEDCLMCRLWREEVAQRMVLQKEHFVAYVPFAPQEPYEIMIVPKDHSVNFAAHLQNWDLALEFAAVIKEAMVKVKKALRVDLLGSDPPYLFCLYTAPYGEEKNYHWHLDFLPRTTIKVGHERGTGEDVIPVLPEEVAEVLRNI